MIDRTTDTLVIGAGIVGISTAYYLKLAAPGLAVTLVDMGEPMALTSAHSGENYRNWWPHPVMERFTNHSIDLIEEIARETDNRVNMSRRGYVLATREANIDDLLAELLTGYADDPKNTIRVHDAGASGSYEPPLEDDWKTAPSGVDVLRNDTLIKQTFPWYDPEIRTLVHIRRGGAISSQQMGQYMLERFGSEQLQSDIIAKHVTEDEDRQDSAEDGDEVEVEARPVGADQADRLDEQPLRRRRPPFSRSSLSASMARSTVSRSLARERGFSRKS